MTTLEAIAAQIPTLAGRIRAGASASETTAAIVSLNDTDIVAVRREAGEMRRLVEQIEGLSAGVIASRSSRAAGHAGLAQRFAALRPRRGGPRFVDADENARAADLVADPRTNDQLSYDLLLDLLRAGAFAEPEAVFGTRQAGVRLVQTVDGQGVLAPVARTEDGLTALPAAVAERRICEAGSVPVTVDSCGNPLDVGRESRLFTPRQRIGLAIRDGGCRWNGCDRPASYCEAHHIDEWARDDGRTDIDRGILLCRFHHMQLHHGGWRITRHRTDEFVLHDRGGGQTVLHPRLPLRYAWGDVDPPPKRFRPAA
ncbi:HNH endonuclease signature motif containing protein [Microbacterium xylanilyticum]